MVMGCQRQDIKQQSYCMMTYAACVMAICDHILDNYSRDRDIRVNNMTLEGQKQEKLLKLATLAPWRVVKISNINNIERRGFQMVVKLATLTQEDFIPVFPCYEKRSIPTFFPQKVLTLWATFEEKMKKFEDDVF